MLNVNITLEHEGEVAVLAEFVQVIRRNRAIQNGGAVDTTPRPEPSVASVNPVDSVDTSIEVIGAIAPEGRVPVEKPAPAAPSAEEISDATLIEAFQKYAATGKPFAELVSLVGSFGAKRVAEIAQERRAEFLAVIGS